MAPVVAGAVVGTILPLLAATILAYCITGYIRDALFGATVKKCIGPSCNILVSQSILCFSHFYTVHFTLLIVQQFQEVLSWVFETDFVVHSHCAIYNSKAVEPL